MKLPMGWNEVGPLELASDCGTPHDEWESTASPKHPRKAVRSWARGSRYVRVCKVSGGDRAFCVHTGFLADEDKDSRRDLCHNLDAALLIANRIMRTGGY